MIMICWPASSRVKSVVVMALIPEEKSTASSALSRAASFPSAASWVGCPYRPYSKRPSAPAASFLISSMFLKMKVEVWTIGVVIAPYSL